MPRVITVRILSIQLEGHAEKSSPQWPCRIVIITSIVVAATAAAVSSNFDAFGTVGGIIGSSVSSAFLILLGVMNGYILYKLIQQMKKVLHSQRRQEEMLKIEGGGVLFRILKALFKLIDRYGLMSVECRGVLLTSFSVRGKCIRLESYLGSDLILLPRSLSWGCRQSRLRRERASG